MSQQIKTQTKPTMTSRNSALLILLLAACLCLFLAIQGASAFGINIYKHRYPFYGGYYPGYSHWGFHGGYGGIGLGGGGYGRR